MVNFWFPFWMKVVKIEFICLDHVQYASTLEGKRGTSIT